MNWKEAIDNIDMTDPANDPQRYGWTHCDPDVFCHLLEVLPYGLNWEEFDKQVQKFWITSWICTDTRVGLAVYKFKGVPFAVSTQTCRKCTEHICFLSEAQGTAFRGWLISLTPPPEIPVMPAADLDTEINPEWFRLAKTGGV